MEKPINFKELAKLRENRIKNTSIKKAVTNKQKRLGSSKGKMTLRELIKLEKPYRINIEDIASISTKYQNCLIKVSKSKTEDVWQCNNCTFVNINVGDNCKMCQKPNINSNSIQHLITNTALDKVFLYGNTGKVESFDSNYMNLKSDNIIGKYYLNSKDIPNSLHILDSLQCIQQYNLDIRKFVILVSHQKSLKAYMLNPVLSIWLKNILPLSKQKDISYLLLDRDITIYEKGKMLETKNIEIELFCYPIRIMFAN